MKIKFKKVEDASKKSFEKRFIGIGLQVLNGLWL